MIKLLRESDLVRQINEGDQNTFEITLPVELVEPFENKKRTFIWTWDDYRKLVALRVARIIKGYA